MNFQSIIFLKGREISSSSLNNFWGSIFPPGVINSQGLARRQSADACLRESAEKCVPREDTAVFPESKGTSTLLGGRDETAGRPGLGWGLTGLRRNFPCIIFFALAFPVLR